MLAIHHFISVLLFTDNNIIHEYVYEHMKVKMQSKQVYVIDMYFK